MRSTFKLGLVLLEVIILLTITVALTAPKPADNTQPFTTILVGSRGHMLPSRPLEGGAAFLDDAIAIGDLLLTSAGSAPGLRVVTLRPGFEFRNYQTFDTANNSSVGSTLLGQLAWAPTGSLIVAAVQGHVRPLDGDHASLDEFARELGAELSPFRAPTASWAVISYKLQTGWRTLAEAYSENRSVSLSFSVLPDPSAYSNFHSQVFYAAGQGPMKVDLSNNLSSAETLTGKIAHDRWKTLGGVMRSSLVFFASPATPATIRWGDVVLGKRPYFSVAFGQQNSTAVTATVRVQDQEVARKELGSKTSAGWQPWEVDLSEWENQTVSFELSIEAHGKKSNTWTHWGLPELNWESQK